MLQPLDETVTVARAAAVLETNGATMRSWRHRGLVSADSKQYTLADVYSLFVAGSSS